MTRRVRAGRRRVASEPSFAEIADADPDEALAAWEAECAHARELVAAAPSLDTAGDRDVGLGRASATGGRAS
jgi:hypothetical protein